MRKFFLSAILAVFLTFQSVTALASEPLAPFLAVLRSQDRGTVLVIDGKKFSDWQYIETDYNQPILNWSDLDDHLAKIKALAGNRPIILEMQVHGDDYLIIDESVKLPGGEIHLARKASMGFLVNHIEKNLPIDRLTVIMDTCFAPSVYKNTIRNNNYQFGTFTENCYHVPTFPIYGINQNIISWNNVVFLQYLFGVPANFTDLRKYEQAPTGTKNTNSNSKECKTLLTIWYVLISSIN